MYADPPVARPIVLLNHGVAATAPADDHSSLFVTDDQLDAQIQHLTRRGRRPIDLSVYLSGAAPSRSFLMTFDDGYLSVLEHAAPRLRDAGVPAVVFVPAGMIGSTTDVPERILDERELRTLIDDYGFEVGAHGFDHRPLVGLDDDELRRQTAGARERLLDVLGKAPRAFAYPHGAVDARARSAVRDAGYQAGFATHEDAGAYARSRVAVYRRDSTTMFRLKVRLAGPNLRTVRRWGGRARRRPSRSPS